MFLAMASPVIPAKKKHDLAYRDWPCWSPSEAHPKHGITLQSSPQGTGMCQSGQEQPQLSGSESWSLYPSLLQNACASNGPVDCVPKIFFALI